MLNRRRFLKYLSRTVIALGSLNPLSALADICLLATGVERGKNRDYIINIDGKNYFGIPTLSEKEARNAFEAALAEWPALRAEIHQKNQTVHKIYDLERDEGWYRYKLERRELLDEIDLISAEWKERHGINLDHREISKSHQKYESYLYAWTDNGRLDGPVLHKVDMDKMLPADITLNKNISVPILSDEEARLSFKSAMAELPEIEREQERLRELIGKLREDKYDRLDAECLRLSVERKQLDRDWQRRHGVRRIHVCDKEHLGIYLCAWTDQGRVVGPRF